MKVYISGKIGEEVLSEATREKFAKAEKMLKQRGFSVFNPTNSGLGIVAEKRVRNAKKRGDKTTWYAEILKLDIAKLSFCEAIYMLADWAQSPGANVEYDYAVAVGIKRLWESKEDAIVFRDDNETISEIWLPL